MVTTPHNPENQPSSSHYHLQQSPYHHLQPDQHMLVGAQPNATSPTGASGSLQPVHIPFHVKMSVCTALSCGTVLVTSAWQTTIADVEMAMAQMSTTYDGQLNAKIAK